MNYNGKKQDMLLTVKLLLMYKYHKIMVLPV